MKWTYAVLDKIVIKKLDIAKSNYLIMTHYANQRPRLMALRNDNKYERAIYVSREP